MLGTYITYRPYLGNILELDRTFRFYTTKAIFLDLTIFPLGALFQEKY